MKENPAPPRVLRTAIVLTALFNVLSLLVIVHTTPIVFTLFMFGAQPLLAIAVVLLLGAVLADLRAKNLF